MPWGGTACIRRQDVTTFTDANGTEHFGVTLGFTEVNSGLEVSQRSAV